MKKKNTDPAKSVLAIAMAFIIVFFITKWHWPIVAAFIIGITALVSPYLSAGFHFIWMKFTYLLSLIIPTILLGIIFYLVLTPVAFLARIFRKKDPLLLAKNQGSTYILSNKIFTQSSFEHPW